MGGKQYEKRETWNHEAKNGFHRIHVLAVDGFE